MRGGYANPHGKVTDFQHTGTMNAARFEIRILLPGFLKYATTFGDHQRLIRLVFEAFNAAPLIQIPDPALETAKTAGPFVSQGLLQGFGIDRRGGKLDHVSRRQRVETGGPYRHH